MSLEAVPCDIADANAFVGQHHRHNRPVTVARFAIAAAVDGKVVGVSIVGNPVARSLCDGWTLEVVRLATDGHHNACSFLYGASWRAARALGWRKLITYTRKDEGGGQLTSCGVEGGCRGEGSVLVLPVAPSRGPGTSAGQVQMGGSVSDDYARGYRDGVEAAAKALETHGRNDAGTKITLACIRSLPPPPASDALAQEAPASSEGEREPFPVTPTCGTVHTITLICALPAGHAGDHAMDSRTKTPTICWNSPSGERCGECGGDGKCRLGNCDKEGCSGECMFCGGSGRSGGSR